MEEEIAHNSLSNVIKAIKQKAEIAKQFGLPKNRKDYKVFKKIMKSIDEKITSKV